MSPLRLRLARWMALTALGWSLAVAAPGCGAGTGDLTGTVSHKGKTVVSGSVTAVGADGLPRGAPIGPDGTYTLLGLPAGEVKLTVSSPNPATLGQGGGRGGTERGKDGRQAPSEAGSAVNSEIVKKWFPIPESYGDIARTTLRATVKRGPTTHNIEMP